MFKKQANLTLLLFKEGNKIDWKITEQTKGENELIITFQLVVTRKLLIRFFSNKNNFHNLAFCIF